MPVPAAKSLPAGLFRDNDSHATCAFAPEPRIRADAGARMVWAKGGPPASVLRYLYSFLLQEMGDQDEGDEHEEDCDRTLSVDIRSHG